METLARTAASYPVPRHAHIVGNGIRKDPRLFFRNSYFASLSPSTLFTSVTLRKSVIVGAKKNGGENPDKKRKEDTHSFVAREDESIGPFPEAVLLREKKVQEDGRLRPDFADAEEEELYEFLNLQLQSQVKVDQMRHYEVVYLIHEKYAEEIRSVNDKIQDFLREKKGKIWRFNDWGMRRLAYQIQKAKNAHYILMNFEMEAKWINDFKSLLDKDERVIRHLVTKRDEAITKDCPPPPEFHTLRAQVGGDDEEDDFDFDDDEEDDFEYDDEEEFDEELDVEEEVEHDDDDDDETEDDVIVINSDDRDDGFENTNGKSGASVDTRENRIPEEVRRR